MRLLGLVAILMFGLVFASCGNPEPAPQQRDLPSLRNDLADGKLTTEHEIPGERFSVVTTYSTDYDVKEWHITDSKTLRISALLKAQPEGKQVEVLVEHVHIDAVIQSRLAGLNGIKQDEMDDKLHVGSQAGFWITETYPYENVFAIEGYSQWLTEGWVFFVGGYGGGEVSEKRLTEESLQDDGGVVGNKFQVVYDLLIRYPGEDLFHTRSFVDEFLVPVAALE